MTRKSRRPSTRHPGPAIALEARIAQSRDLRQGMGVAGMTGENFGCLV